MNSSNKGHMREIMKIKLWMIRLVLSYHTMFLDCTFHNVNEITKSVIVEPWSFPLVYIHFITVRIMAVLITVEI